ncbi:MAG TPA: hypothetical protein VK003_21645 [Oceanobacillus sp.]|nr:hypothetical protein [Oceanobacillus sp.]
MKRLVYVAFLFLAITTVGFAQESEHTCDDLAFEGVAGEMVFRNLRTDERFTSTLPYAPGTRGFAAPSVFYSIDATETADSLGLFRLTSDHDDRELLYVFPEKWEFVVTSLSPDGTKLAISRSSRGDQPLEYGAAIGIYDLERNLPPEQFSEISAFGGILTGFTALALTWSPDGEYLAATLLPTGPEEEIHILSADCILSGEAVCESTAIESSPARGQVFPTWSPDSERLAFICYGTGVCIWDSVDGEIHTYPTTPDLRTLYWSPCSGQLYGWLEEQDGERLSLVEITIDGTTLSIGDTIVSSPQNGLAGLITLPSGELPVWLALRP